MCERRPSMLLCTRLEAMLLLRLCSARGGSPALAGRTAARGAS